MEKGIWSMTHLVDSDGCILSYEDFCLKYNLIGNRDIFKSVTKAIPNSFLCLIKEIVKNSTITPHFPKLLVGCCDFSEIKFPNKTIRNMFNYISHPTVSYRNSISQFFSKKTLHMLQTKFFNFPIPPKTK